MKYFIHYIKKKLKEENEQESTIVVQRQLLSAQNKITALPGTITNEQGLKSFSETYILMRF